MGPGLNQVRAQEHLADLSRAANRKYLVDLADFRLQEGATLRLTADDAKIVDAVRAHGSVHAKQIYARMSADAADPSKAAVSRRLKALVAHGVLRKEGILLGARYTVASAHPS